MGAALMQVETFSARRLDDWPQQLAAYIAAGEQAGFAWGLRDCVLAAAGAVQAMTGRHPLPGLAGTYASAASALSQIQARSGQPGLPLALDMFFRAAGFPPCALFGAQRGDLVLARAPTPSGRAWPALGFLHLNGRDVLFAAPLGWSRLALRDCLQAWRVP